MKNFYILVFCLLIPQFLLAQNPIGLAALTNFSKLNYKGGNQNWDIQQDKSGILYFANNEGLLTYNGESWKIYSIPNRTVVRSVQISPDGKIYIGAQDELGYFFPDDKGVLKYTSLKSLIPKAHRSFTDVWNVIISDGRVFFRSTNEMFELNKGLMRCYEARKGWLYLGKAGNHILAQPGTGQLLEYIGGNWILACQLPSKALVTAVVTYSKDTLLVSTLKEGIFLLVNHRLIKKLTGLDKLFASIRINSLQKISQNLFAVGSGYNGCYIINHQGNIIQSFSDKQGLQKNNIRSLFLDRDQNIWLGLDDGISYIAYNSAIKQIYTEENRKPATYSVRVFNKILYIGTSDAVFSLPLKESVTDLSANNGQFTEVPDSRGQVWNLSEVNHHLLLANEDGTYDLIKNSLKKIVIDPGTWLFKNLAADSGSSQILAGTYDGLSLFNFKNNEFTSKGPLEGLKESLRFLSIDYNKGIIWASHPYRGVYKIILSADNKKILSYQLLTEKDGLPSALHNFVYKIKNRNIVATQNGIYEYDYDSGRFRQSLYFKPIFKQLEIQYLNEDKDGNIWFIGNKKVGVIDFSGSKDSELFNTVYFPELTAKVLAGFENIYPYNRQNIFVGANNGVFHINYEKFVATPRHINVLIGQVKLLGDKDSIIFGGYFSRKGKIENVQVKDAIIKLPNKNNSISFEFSSTLFDQHSNIEYSYKLEGFDPNWSVWNSKNEKEYTNLSFGTYTFKVKARNNLGHESEFAAYTFEIKPAWYETIYSFIAYLILIILLLYLLIRYQKKKHEKKEENLIYVHKLELDQIENEVISLKNEKLETEVNHKNKELATATMHLVQRGKLLAKIKEGLMPLLDATATTAKECELSKVIRLINEAERSDNDWDNFAIHFDQIHSDYLSTLKAKFPDLSATDLKMCAYLKINLTSKEIAQLMSITIRAVEVSRYRLRKKLNITANTNLFDFLVKETSKELQN